MFNSNIVYHGEGSFSVGVANGYQWACLLDGRQYFEVVLLRDAGRAATTAQDVFNPPSVGCSSSSKAMAKFVISAQRQSMYWSSSMYSCKRQTKLCVKTHLRVEHCRHVLQPPNGAVPENKLNKQCRFSVMYYLFAKCIGFNYAADCAIAPSVQSCFYTRAAQKRNTLLGELKAKTVTKEKTTMKLVGVCMHAVLLKQHQHNMFQGSVCP